MTITNGYNNAVPHHRQNRRRERPGSRTRRTISNIRDECEQGILDARDPSVPLPSDKAKPSPLMRQNFDQSWQRWKARQAEAAVRTRTEQDTQLLEQERLLLFGGEIDDDELFRTGILYGEQPGCCSLPREDGIFSDLPLRQEAPMFVIKPARRSRQRSTWRSLPLYLSFSNLSEDSDIAHLISPNRRITPTIQHRTPIPSTAASIIDFDTPQSLPPATALSQSPGSGNPNLLHDINTPTFAPAGEDWTFITHTHTRHDTTPFSEPETWILHDDS